MAMAAVTPERVKQNLTYICKQLEPQQFLLGVVDILHDSDGELLGKKIEKSTDLSRSMLVLQIYDCLKRRPNWTRAFVNFLRQEGELDILRKLGEQTIPSLQLINPSPFNLSPSQLIVASNTTTSRVHRPHRAASFSAVGKTPATVSATSRRLVK